MGFHRNPRAEEMWGHTRGSWLSDDRRFLFVGDQDGWMVLSNGADGGVIDLFLEGVFGDTNFPTRREAAAALELSLAEAPYLPTLEEMDAESQAMLVEALSSLSTEKLIKVAEIASSGAKPEVINSQLLVALLEKDKESVGG